MTKKKVNDSGDVENTTATELQILKNIESSFWKQNPKDVRRNTASSMKWFSQYVPRSFNRVRTARMFRDSNLWEDKPRPGHMYFYEYDAKHKGTLPVWDRYPLVFFWEIFKGEADGWGEPGVTYAIGINLHYLSPRLRFEAMRMLLSTRNRKSYDDRTKLKISWSILKSMANSKLFEHSVKVYRMDHIRSKFVKIPPASWELALWLPLARWQKGSKSDAWKLK